MSTVRTSHRDVNYLSIAGTGNITNLNAEAAPAVGAGQVGALIPNPLILTPSNPQVKADQFDSLLKIADGAHDLTLGSKVAVIPAGMECCVDIANGAKSVAVVANYGNPGDICDQPISIKGGCDNITIAGQVFARGKTQFKLFGHAFGWDVLIGNWCDENQSADTDVMLLCTGGSANCSSVPLRIAIGRGLMAYLFGNRKKHTLGTNTFVLLPSLAVWAYWWGKRAYVGLLNVLPKKLAVKLDPAFGT